MSRDLETLRTVFAYHVVTEVIGADGVKRPEEASFLHRRWPRQHLAEQGLLGPEGTETVAFREALDEALAVLPERLSEAQKLVLVETCLEAGLADGHLERHEAATLSRVADRLGLPASRWLEHLATTDHVGEIDLPEPEGVEAHLMPLDDPDAATVTPADAATETPDDG